MNRRPKLTILVVDDVPDNLLVLSALLRDEYNVKVSTSGQQALQLACAHKPPDLILLDVIMPDLDGYETCRRLKANPETQHIPVIFLTTKCREDDIVDGLQLGAVDYISRPIVPHILLARVRTHLMNKQASDFLRDQNAFLEAEVQRRTQELFHSTLEKQRLENDLKVASKLQISMLPRPHYDRQDWRIEAFVQPARFVGGDLYDYIPVQIGGRPRLLFVVGDVSDKGVVAALFLARVLTLLRWLAPHCLDPAQLLAELNSALCRDNAEDMFVTLACGLVDLQTGEVAYSSGGHEPPLIWEGLHKVRCLDLVGGPALGIIPEAEFPLHRFQLKTNQRLILLSDGLSEAQNPSGEEFGYRRLMVALGGLSGDLLSVRAECLEAIRKFIMEAEQHDDMTMLILERKSRV
jgi:phosphoserine phosphatase RsbU/P